MKEDSYYRSVEEIRSNDDQWSVFESKCNCVIMAGPGSGKTKTITVKIARLIKEEIKYPRKIACITYSNACVSEIRSRLKNLDIENSKKLLLSTVHSFCLTELVIPYAHLAGIGVPNPLIVSSPSQSRECFSQACSEQLGGEPAPNWLQIECDRIRRTILDRNSKEWQQASKREKGVIETYEKKLSSKGLIDFDGLVLTGLELVENYNWVRRSIKAKYPIIVIDEYQDLGLPLHRMVLALMNKAGVRIIAVGDPDQSIYGFTGAKPNLLRTLAKTDGVKSIPLKLNYRCADQIITASKVLLINPPDYKSHDGTKGEIRIYKLDCDLRGQTDFALRTVIPDMFKQNPVWKPGDIAFLYQSYKEGNVIANAANSLNLRYFRIDNGSPIKRSRLTEWLMDAAKWCSGGWQNGTVNLTQLMNSWRLIKRSADKESILTPEKVRLISTLFNCRDGSIPLLKWLIALQDKVFNEMLDKDPSMADEKDIFKELLKATGKGGALQNYNISIFGNQGKSPDQINLMTFHSSKGLEFQAVIMAGLEEGEFPKSYERSQERLDEAKRLFYVGITRAKRIVHLMYSSKESEYITMIREVTESSNAK